MELINALNKFEDDSANGRAVRQEALESIVLMLSPIIPHACQQLWNELGHNDDIVTAAWPVVDESALVQEAIEMVVLSQGR